MTPSQALQRVVVRMHYDPGFCQQVFAGHCPPDIAAPQHAMLLAVDPRAFACDPERPLRTLQALIEESPLSSWWAGFEHLKSFFQSEAFHRGIMDRKRLIEVYLDWLTPQCPDFCRLESAIARARRRVFPQNEGPPTHLSLGPGCALVEVAAGSLEEYQRLRQSLGDDILASLLHRPRPKKARLKFSSTMRQTLIVQSQQIGGCNEALYKLLTEFESPIPLDRIVAIAGKHGLGPEDGAELFQELRADGLLLRLALS